VRPVVVVAVSSHQATMAARRVPSSLFFDGCSWGCIYYAGIYSGLWQSCTPADLSKVRWGGVSSGALMALGAALGKPPADMKQLYDELAHVATLYGVFGKMSVYHEVVLLRWLPDGGDEWRRLNDKLFVGVTRPVDRFELVSEWGSNEELRDVLHGSMHIPFYMTRIASVKGAWALDGGFGFNGPNGGREVAAIDEHTVTVGADCRTCFDICPKEALTWDECFAPTDPAGRARILAQGEADAASWCRGVARTAAPQKAAQDSVVRKVLAPLFDSNLGHRLLCLLMWWLRSVEQHGRRHALVALCGWWWLRWRRSRLRGAFPSYF
jgi:hypothetical protein